MILLICIFRPFTGMGNKELGLWYGRRKGGFYRDELREGSGKRGAGTFWETAELLWLFGMLCNLPSRGDQDETKPGGLFVPRYK
jgi:hypothetical protein